MLADHPAVLNDPEPSVLADSLGSSTVNLRVSFWLDGHEYSWLKVRSSMVRLVKFGFPLRAFRLQATRTDPYGPSAKDPGSCAWCSGTPAPRGQVFKGASTRTPPTTTAATPAQIGTLTVSFSFHPTRDGGQSDELGFAKGEIHRVGAHDQRALADCTRCRL